MTRSRPRRPVLRQEARPVLGPLRELFLRREFPRPFAGPLGPRTGRLRRDEGLATVFAAVTTATLCVVFAVVLALGQAVVARHRAGGAADLAALAAADRALEGAAAACRSAREVAGAQGALIVRCSVQGEIADVTARVRDGPYTPEVRSRAGPPSAAPAGPVRPAEARGLQESPVPPTHPTRPAHLTHPVHPAQSLRQAHSLQQPHPGRAGPIGGVP